MELQLLHITVRDDLPAPVDARAYAADPLRAHSGLAGQAAQAGVRVVLFCSDTAGKTVAVHVTGWEPRALVKLRARPSGEPWAEHELGWLAGALQGGGDRAPRATESVTAKRLFDFHIDYARRERQREQFVGVRFGSIRGLKNVRRTLGSVQKRAKNQGASPGIGAYVDDVCEHRVAPETKFLDEHGIAPCGWLTVGEWENIEDVRGHRHTHCRREVVCPASALRPSTRDDCAPFTIASVDIECRQGADGSFPKALRDPIICVGTVFAAPGAEGFAARKNVIHTLRDCAPLPETEIQGGFDSEIAMLNAWRADIVKRDVACLIGYNLWGFDYGYMVNRYNHLVLHQHGLAGGDGHAGLPSDRGWVQSEHVLGLFPRLSMFVCEDAEAREKHLSSAAMGFNKLFEIKTTGRTTLDLLLYMKTNYKLSKYTLNAVATQFVGDQKEDIAHADIYRYFDQGPEERAKYCSYCVQDCALPLQIAAKLAVVEDYVQTARVQWTQLSDLVSRGQQIRVFNMLHKYAHQQGYVIDKEPRKAGDASEEGGEGYEGATVLSPTPGYYQTPVATLDFASLYPSIMRAHNLCYTTRWPHAAAPPEWLGSETHGTCTFITDERFRGVLPSMLDDLLRERKETKRLMATEADPTRRALLDKKQQAQKVSANSVYGFTGAVERGMYPCADVARTVTWCGRDYIARTRAIVEQRYDLRVIYGDTDSVMVDMGPTDIAQAFKDAEVMGDYITAQFPGAIVLEFEKVYCPYLLHGKKRYVGCKYEDDPSAPPKMDCKGIEMVRRDNAPCAREIQKRALTKLVMERDVPGAVEEIRRVIARIVDDTMPFDEYVITKALAESYANNNLAHVQAAAKMEARGVPVPAGGRIEYVIVRGPGKLYEKAEDASHARRNQLIVDREYYLEKQIMTPLRNLLTRVFRLDPLFDAALGSVRDQDARADRRLAVAALGMGYSAAPEPPPPPLVDEARSVIDSVEAPGPSSDEGSARSSQGTLDGFLRPCKQARCEAR